MVATAGRRSRRLIAGRRRVISAMTASKHACDYDLLRRRIRFVRSTEHGRHRKLPSLSTQAARDQSAVWTNMSSDRTRRRLRFPLRFITTTNEFYYGGEDEVEICKRATSCCSARPASAKRCLRRRLPKCWMCRSRLRTLPTLTEAGYVGEDVENILLRLIQAADYDIERAERGIIYIDEIDKIARKSRKSFHYARCQRRRRAAGAAENSGRHGLQRSAAGRAEASAAGIYPDRHDEHPVYLRRCV